MYEWKTNCCSYTFIHMHRENKMVIVKMVIVKNCHATRSCNILSIFSVFIDIPQCLWAVWKEQGQPPLPSTNSLWDNLMKNSMSNHCIVIESVFSFMVHLIFTQPTTAVFSAPDQTRLILTRTSLRRGDGCSDQNFSSSRHWDYL